MRRNDRFRFSLQWAADTEEKIRVGTLLEQLGNKKSGFIVMAVTDYLQRHPELEVPGAKIRIAYQPLQTREQLMAMVRDLVKISMNEFLEREAASVEAGRQQEVPPGPSERDIDAMVANLAFFDQ